MARHSLVPASAPTSPAVTRSKSDRHPVTPQRILHHSQIRQFSSPYTPGASLSNSFSTPYTPISLRSFSSSNASSLATPASTMSRNRISVSMSPEVNTGSKSLADIAENWRNRANENGIKVTSSDDSCYEAADDSSVLDISSSVIDKSLLPAPFLSTQRRARAFSHTQIQPPLSTIPDPAQFCTPCRAPRLPNVLETPPPQPGFRLRGSITDPAHTRRRPAFDQSHELFDIDEDEYDPYPQFISPVQPQTMTIPLTDPFNMQSVPVTLEPLHYFQPNNQNSRRNGSPTPAKACSVCATSGGSLAILNPCDHPLCSACLTSALNIVGEKDMECAVCKAKVNDFKLVKTLGDKAVTSKKDAYTHLSLDDGGISMRPNVQGRGSPMVVESFESFDDFIDCAQGASTPIASHRAGAYQERVVLRIDNVPWDITPPAIAAWLRQPVMRVHVLLDRKGKTLSHAYVEMTSPAAAQAALRTAQNSVLGRGKRARGVTVTKSSQEELMKALFPSWLGNFDGARPSLAGLDNEHVVATLQRGLVTEAELHALLHLIRAPDSHFLKVPSLPFHSLISILSKFPSDDDSRVFWSTPLRDMLYEITHAAVQVLLSRIEESPLSEWTALMGELVRAALDCGAFTSDQMSKLSDILEASTPQSISSPPLAHDSLDSSPSPPTLQHQLQEECMAHDAPVDRAAYNKLAKEFGVEADIIEALAQRLSGMC